MAYRKRKKSGSITNETKELRLRLIRESIELKIKNAISEQLDRDIENLWLLLPIKKMVIQSWATKQKVKYGDTVDEFDGLFYESEYYVFNLVQMIQNIFEMELDDHINPSSVSITELTDLVFKLKGYVIEK